jgi:PAS domain S-box-containing protein
MADEPEALDALSLIADPLALLRGLFEHSPVPYAIFNSAGHFVLANPAYRLLFRKLPPPEYNIFADEVTRRIGTADLVQRAFAGETVRTPALWYDPNALEHVRVTQENRVAISCTFFPLRAANGEIREVAIAYKDVTPERTALEQVEAREREARELSEKLEEQMALLQATIQQSGDGIIVADRHGVLRIFNPEAERQYGHAALDVDARAWSAAPPRYDRDLRPLPVDDCPLQRALVRSERVENACWLVRRADGSFRTLTGTATPLSHADGSPAGALLITRDETERLALEEQLRSAIQREQRERENLGRTEAEFRAIFELAAVGMAQADPQTGRLSRVNQRLCELTGYSAAELLDVTFSDLTHPDDRLHDSEAFQRMVRGEAAMHQNEKRYVRKDGSIVWLQVTGTVLRDATGEPTCALAVLVDVSERVRVEAKAKAIADNATVGLFMMDERQHCVFMNPAAERITGYTQAELAGRPLRWFARKPTQGVEPEAAGDRPSELPQAEPVTGAEDLFVHRNGYYYPVSFTASPLRDAAGLPRGTVVELRDVTREKLAEAEREQLLCQLERAVRVRDDFLSIAGHEIRTPLTALLLNLKTLTHAAHAIDTCDEQRRFLARLERARDNTQRLQRLVEDLLDVSRIASTRLALEPEELDLAELVRTVVQRQQEQVGRTDGALRVHAPATLRGRLDRLRVEQVVSNLLTNALKYGAGQPIDVELTGSGDRAILRVVDRGIGIDAEHQTRIFERFERAVSIRHYGGFGLGLWIARQVVEASGGSIAVESVLGSGSTFTVSLPLR